MIHAKMLAGTLSKDDMQVVEFLREDVNSVRDFVMEMNQLVSTHVTDQESVIRVSEVVKSIRRVFRSKIKQIKIEVVGDLWLVAKVDYINRILINSIINSCEAIHKNNISDGKILVYCESNFMGISDNSGSHLGADILKKLNNPNVSFSNKSEGSGLGVLLIKDYVGALGGSFKYSNHVDGVGLKITFPHRMLLTSKNTKGPVFNES